MLPLGDYSLRIAPAAAMATINTTTMQKCTLFAGRFDGHRNAVVLSHASPDGGGLWLS
jgi:hypothetical protein